MCHVVFIYVHMKCADFQQRRVRLFRTNTKHTFKTLSTFDRFRDLTLKVCEGLETTLDQACWDIDCHSAMCVQRFDDSLSCAIHITYRISQRSSSIHEPRDPPLKVVSFVFSLRLTARKGYQKEFGFRLLCWVMIGYMRFQALFNAYVCVCVCMLYVLFVCFQSRKKRTITTTTAAA